MLKANNSIVAYEAKIGLMEREIYKAQKAWKVRKETSFKRPAIYDKVTETEVFIEVPKQMRDKFTETKLLVESVETQCTKSSTSTPSKSKTEASFRDSEDDSESSSRDEVEYAVNGKIYNDDVIFITFFCVQIGSIKKEKADYLYSITIQFNEIINVITSFKWVNY